MNRFFVLYVETDLYYVNLFINIHSWCVFHLLCWEWRINSLFSYRLWEMNALKFYSICTTTYSLDNGMKNSWGKSSESGENITHEHSTRTYFLILKFLSNLIVSLKKDVTCWVFLRILYTRILIKIAEYKLFLFRFSDRPIAHFFL